MARQLALIGGITLAVGLLLVLGAALFAVAWVQSPLLHGSADFVYVCAGVNLQGRFRFGFGWAANLAGMTPLYVNLPETVCGYLPRPAFLGPFGYHVYQP